MNNYTSQKGKRLIDLYRGGAIKLYELCDFINKKAMNWYALNIEFSPEEVELIEKVQRTMDQADVIIKKVKKDEDLYDFLDLDYGVYMNNCLECEGKVKVSRHIKGLDAYTCNIYKCVECNKEFEEHQPNMYEECLIYFKDAYSVFQDYLSTENLSDKELEMINERIKGMEVKEKEIMDHYQRMSEIREPLTAEVLESIATNGELYKEFTKLKYYFDKEK
jgi:hypothetical protein